jgi:hypothetical protein
MFNSGEVLWCGEVDIVFLGVNFSHSLLILDLSTDGMLSRLHDTTLREICDRFYNVCLVHTMCTEAERACHFVSPSHVTFFFLISYTLSGVKVALLLRPRSHQFQGSCVNFLVYNVSSSTYKYNLA